MNDTDLKVEEAAKLNGDAAVAAVEKAVAEKSSKAKPKKREGIPPWVAAGYKTREEWRVGARKEKREKAEAKKAAKKAAKASKAPTAKKAAKKAVATSRAKGKEDKRLHKYPVTPAERKEAHERTLAAKAAMAKREEANDKEDRVLKCMKVGSQKTIIEMSEIFGGSKPEKYLKVKNALRWLVATKHFKKVDRGTYERLK